MSARSRGRAIPNQDADEERRLWQGIKDKAREIDTMVARSHDIGAEIVQLESQQAALLDAGKLSSAASDERIGELYRENVRLCDEIALFIEGGSDNVSLLESIKILAVLREASEESAALLQVSQGQRSASVKLSRGPKKPIGKSQPSIAASTEDGEDSPAAPSPRIVIGVNRLGAKDKPTRSGSIPATREASVKIEDGESVASSADGTSSATGTTKTSGASRPSNRLVLKLGEIVFCRHDMKAYDPKKSEPLEGEGILCRVTNVIGEGKQRRYEVQDADLSGGPPPPQRASVSQLIQIPQSNKGLGDLPKGKQVLAQYPDTTTFYKAEVIELWRAKDLGTTEKGELVRLYFQDDENPREVERRFVLTEK